MKHFMDIERLKPAYVENFFIGENIVIQEKIDGSNSSFDIVNGEIRAYSRRQELNSENTLNGFYNFVQALDFGKLNQVIGEKYIIFGEWLTPHKVKYPEDKYRKFYMFDVYDKEQKQYLAYPYVRHFADLLGLTMVPVFYTGPFTGWDLVKQYVGKTELGASPCGEGVVCKTTDPTHIVKGSDSGRMPAFIKVVSDEFSEIQKVKTIDFEKVAKREADMAIVETIVNERRVEKCFSKLIDYGDIPADWDEKTMGLIAKILPKEIYNDCVKEENETVQSVENFGKYCSAIVMKYVKELLKKKNEV